MNKLLRFANKIAAWYAWYERLPYVRAASGSPTFHDGMDGSMAKQRQDELAKDFAMYKTRSESYGFGTDRTKTGHRDQPY